MNKHSYHHHVTGIITSPLYANCHLETTYQFFEFTVSANCIKFSCILQASGHTAAGLVRHPGSVRPDEQTSVAEYIIHFSSKSNKVSRPTVYWLTLCYTCKWCRHALTQQCRDFQSSTTTKKARKCSRLFCQDQDQDQDFYLETKT